MAQITVYVPDAQWRAYRDLRAQERELFGDGSDTMSTSLIFQEALKRAAASMQERIDQGVGGSVAPSVAPSEEINQ